jgi:putative oxidoreductase
MQAFGPLAGLAGRILLAQIFVISGLAKFPNGAEMGARLADAGLPGFLIYVAGAFELLAGIAIILGFQTRLAALGLSGFCVLTAIMFHNNFADQTQVVMFLKNIALAGGLLLLVRDGAGAYSLESRR